MFVAAVRVRVVAALRFEFLAGESLGFDGLFLRRAVEPYINAIGSTPKIIFLPILFLMFGVGIESKIANAFAGRQNNSVRK